MNYRTERLPIVTFSLIGINTLILLITYICSLSTDGESDLWVYQHLWLIPANCSWCAPLTSMFVHEGIMHLLGNMIFLFLFGSCVEDLIGRLRFAIFYLMAGLIAEFVYIAMSPAHFHSVSPMGGASGAISGCMGMYLLLRADAEIEFKYFLWLFVFVRAGEFIIPAWVAILFWFGRDLLFAVIGLASKSGGGGVAFGAHVGGFLGGLGLLAAYRWLAKPKEEMAEAEADTSGPIINTAAMLRTTRAVARPAVETGETPTLFLHNGQQQTGPFTLSQVQAMLRDGVIGTETSYWSEGMDNWQSVSDLAG